MDGKRTDEGGFLWHLLHRPYKGAQFGAGFVVEERLRGRLLALTQVDERLTTIHIRFAPKPRRKRRMIFPRMPFMSASSTLHRDVKIVRGNFNVRVYREGIFGVTVRKFRLPYETNGLRLIGCLEYTESMQETPLQPTEWQWKWNTGREYYMKD